MSVEIVLAADLGGTNLRMAAIDSQGNILYRLKRETPNNGESGEEIVRAIADGAAECLENCASEQVRNFSAAILGTIDFKNGTIKTSPNLPSLDNFQIVSELKKRSENEFLSKMTRTRLRLASNSSALRKIQRIRFA